MAGDLELLTVGRISIDLYCQQIGADWHAAESFSKAIGGSPTNVAVAAARLGHRAAVVTKVGVNTRFVGTEPGTVTPLAFAVLDPPEDPQLLFRRDPPVPDFQLRPDDVDGATVAGVPILWVTASALSHEPSASTTEGLLGARGRRRHTVLDLDYRPSFWGTREEASARIGRALDHVTIAVGNREECAVAVGTDDPREAAARLRAKGVDVAIVKLGGDGVLVFSEQGEQLIEPPHVAVLCGLGAGDAFGGALCHGLLAGWSHDRTIAFANAAGGIVASRLLCSAAMPDEDEVVEILGRSAAPRGGALVEGSPA
jgi:5-dehydro-2-deoxygluconokinase